MNISSLKLIFWPRELSQVAPLLPLHDVTFVNLNPWCVKFKVTWEDSELLNEASLRLAWERIPICSAIVYKLLKLGQWHELGIATFVLIDTKASWHHHSKGHLRRNIKTLAADSPSEMLRPSSPGPALVQINQTVTYAEGMSVSCLCLGMCLFQTSGGLNILCLRHYFVLWQRGRCKIWRRPSLTRLTPRSNISGVPSGHLSNCCISSSDVMALSISCKYLPRRRSCILEAYYRVS